MIIGNSFAKFDMDKTELHEFFTNAVIRSALGISLGHVLHHYLEIVLSSQNLSISLTGSAFDLPDQTEAFVVTAAECQKAQQWASLDGEVRQPDNLLLCRQELNFERFWTQERTVRYYSSLQYRNQGLKTEGLLRSTAAIEFRAVSCTANRLVLFSTYEYPCSIELATEPARCNEILSELSEFSLL